MRTVVVVVEDEAHASGLAVVLEQIVPFALDGLDKASALPLACGPPGEQPPGRTNPTAERHRSRLEVPGGGSEVGGTGRAGCGYIQPRDCISRMTAGREATSHRLRCGSPTSFTSNGPVGRLITPDMAFTEKLL